MGEVKRWKLKGFLPGIEGESKAVFQPTVVLDEDYDAALAREAALREELDKVCGDEWRKDKRQIHDLQQRLTDAERYVQNMIDCSQGQDSIATGYLADILAKLNPAEREVPVATDFGR